MAALIPWRTLVSASILSLLRWAFQPDDRGCAHWFRPYAGGTYGRQSPAAAFIVQETLLEDRGRDRRRVCGDQWCCVGRFDRGRGEQSIYTFLGDADERANDCGENRHGRAQPIWWYEQCRHFDSGGS